MSVKKSKRRLASVEPLEDRRMLTASDFNSDGLHDCTDVDALVAVIADASNDLDFDLTGDGFVDREDLTEWRIAAGLVNNLHGGAYLPADINLDAVVDISDFNVWNSNKFNPDRGWCGGDLNADGFVDISDFNLWNSNKFQSTESVPLEVLSVSPSLGEQMVNLTRTAIVEFSRAVDPATVTESSFFAIGRGETVPASVLISADETRATLIFDDPLPAATELQLVIDGNQILGRNQRFLDANRDGQFGGIAEIGFRTVASETIPGTAVMGHVYASEPGANGENVPLAGITLRLVGDSSVTATTDINGFFTLGDLPVPEFFMDIDGSTVTAVGGDPVPTHGYFPEIEKRFESRPGESIPLQYNGESFNIYLPFVLNDAINDIVPGEPTIASLPEQQVLGDPELAMVQLTVPADSLVDQEGNPGTEVGIFRVASDRLPAPLPDGLSHSFDITIQADAPIFDTPAPIQFPNTDGLAPGEQALLMSFDHEVADWVVVGEMTVSADGETLQSEPGDGVRAPGWHGVQRGAVVGGRYRKYLPRGARLPQERATQAFAAAKAGIDFGMGLHSLYGQLTSGDPNDLLDVGNTIDGIGDAEVELDTHLNEARDRFGNRQLRFVDDPIAVFNRATELLEQLGPILLQIEDDIASLPFDQLNFTGLYPVFLETQSSVNLAMNLYGKLLVEAEDTGQLGTAAYVAAIVNGNIIRRRANAAGDFQFVVPEDTRVDIYIYDADGNSIGTISTTSPNSGETINVGDVVSLPVAESSFNFDSDGDELIDIAEDVVGTSKSNPDSDTDGINDFAEISQGLNPTSDNPVTTGVIATLPLTGQANDVEVVGSVLDAQTQLAFIATGSHGLAIVDASTFSNPIVLGELDLPGDAEKVGVDSKNNVAIVTSSTAGVHFVDVADTMNPILLETVNKNASLVEIVEGVAYLGVGNGLLAYDVLTRDRISAVEIGTGTITGLARDNSTIFLMDSSNTLSAIELVGLELQVRGSLQLSEGGGNLFAGGGVAYVPATSRFNGGFSTVDVSDPTSLTLLSDPSTPAGTQSPRTDMAVNGSGVALLVGENFNQNVVELYDVSDPSITDSFITSFEVSAPLRGVAIGSGLAYVANDTSGLQVINYLAFDGNGVQPILNVNETVTDVDDMTVGVQVIEGTTNRVDVEVADDVQVRNVELLVDGFVVDNDVSFPWSLAFDAPVIEDSGMTAEVEVRVTDTGGNRTSMLLDVDVVEDSFAPTFVAADPASGATRGMNFSTVRVSFSESMDPSTLTVDTIRLRDLDGNLFSPNSIELRSIDQIAQLTFDQSFDPGQYEVVLNSGAETIADRAGNLLVGTDLVATTFEVFDADAVWINDEVGDWSDPANWDNQEVPSEGNNVFLPAGANVRLVSDTLRSITVSGGAEAALEVTGNGSVLDGVTLDTDLVINSFRTLTVENGLVLNGTATLNGTSSSTPARLRFSGNGLLDGAGTVVLNGSGFNRTIVDTTGGIPLTIGAGITIRGETNGGLVGTSGVETINNGTILVDSASSATLRLIVRGSSVTNNGTLQALGGELEVENLQNNGTASVDGGELTLSGDWINNGTLALDSGQLNLDGTFGETDLGSYSVSDGIINITGLLENSGNTLDLVANATWQLDEGQIIGGTIVGEPLRIVGNSLVDGVTLDADVIINSFRTLTVENGLVLNGTATLNGTSSSTPARLRFSGNGLLDGAGTVVLNGSGFNRTIVDTTGGIPLTIGAGITIRGETNGGLVGTSGVETINNGTILVDSASSASLRVIVRGSSVTNNGTLQVFGGELEVDNLQNNGTASVDGGELTLSGDWINNGTLALDSGQLNLGGTFGETNLGSYSVSDGIINITGLLENSGNTFDLVANATWQLDEGQIIGGTIVGEPLRIVGNSLVDGLTLDADVIINSFRTLTVENGLVLNGTATLNGTSSSTPARLRFSGNGLLDGAGTVVLNGSGFNRTIVDTTGGIPLTIGAGIMIRGETNGGLVGTSGVETINNGTILVDSASSASLRVIVRGSSVTNNGTLQALGGELEVENLQNNGTASVDGGELTLSGDWINNGTLALDSGQLNLDGTFGETDLGSYSVSDGIINITGLLENSGNTLDLVANATWQLDEGQIIGGTIVGEPLRIVGNSLVDGVTLDADVIINSFRTLTVENGLVLNGTATLNGTSSSTPARLRFSGNGLLDGAGTVVLNGSGFNRTIVDTTGGIPLTIGAGITIRGETNGGLVGTSGVETINNGTILVDSASSATLRLIVRGSSVTNNGTLQALGGELEVENLQNNGTASVDGGELTLSGDWINNGTLALDSGQLNLDGTFGETDLGSYSVSDGIINITGLLENSGNTLDLVANATWQLDEGQIIGGTIVGEPLRIVGNSLVDGVTLDADVIINSFRTLTVENGLVLNGTATLNGTSSSTPARLRFSGNGLLDGAGTVVLNGSGFNRTIVDTTGGIPLTIGAGITIRGETNGGLVGTSGVETINNGTILVDSASSATLRLIVRGSSVTNNGTLQALGGELEVENLQNNGTASVDGGELTLSGDWINSDNGTFSVIAGQLNLGGTFDESRLGSFSASGGITNIVGVVENIGNTFELIANTEWQLDEAEIVGGTLTGASLRVVDDSVLNGVTVNVDVIVDTFQRLTIENGLVLNGTATLNGTSSSTPSTLRFRGNGMLDGVGTVVLNGNAFNRTLVDTEGEIPLTIGAGITIRSDSNGGLIGTNGSELINNGTILANTSNTSSPIVVRGSTVTNNGRIESVAGQLTVSTTLQHSGQALLGSGARLVIDGNFLLTATSNTQFDLPLDGALLEVTGNVDFAGQLSMNPLAGFNPLLGQSLELMTFAARANATDEFDTFAGGNLGNGLDLQPVYAATNLRVEVVNALPRPMKDANDDSDSNAVDRVFESMVSDEGIKRWETETWFA